MRAHAVLALLVALPACRAAEPPVAALRLVQAFTPAAVSRSAATAAPSKPQLEWRFGAASGEAASGATQGWEATSGVAGLALREGRLAGRSTTKLPLLHVARTSVGDADPLHSIEVRLRASAGTRLTVRFSRDEKPDVAKELKDFGDFPEESGTPIVAGPELRTYTFRRPETVPSSEIRHVFLRPTDVAGATFEIESVRIVFRREHLAGIVSGVSWQGLSGVFQETLVSRSPEVVSVEVVVPARPWLDLAVGTVEEAPIGFRVALRRSGRDPVVLLERTVTTPHRWEDASVDLAPFAGERVTLDLSVIAEGGGRLGFWGAPVVRSRLALPRPAAAADTPRGEPPQGVILVWADTLRRDHLDVYGYPRPTAPALRRMAAEGALFQNCLVQATWTKVSTPSLMTSLYPTSHGVTTWDDRLASSPVRLAEVYRDAGYATFSFASNDFTGQMTNLHKGFEQVHEMGSLPDRERQSNKTARVGIDRLFAWLEPRRDVPFFAFLSVLDPHDPYRPYAPYNSLFADSTRDARHERETEAVRKGITNPILQRFAMPSREELVAARVDPEAYVSHNRDLYDGAIRGLDAEMGRLMERLRAWGLDRKTLVVFTGDHGEEFLEHGRTFHGQSTYGELNAVPLIFWRPGSVPAGAVVPDVVQTIDLMPTLLAMSGLRGPAAMQGQTLVPLLAPPRSGGATARAAGPGWQPRPAITEQIKARDDVPPLDLESVAVVADGWKLIHHTRRYPPRPEFELFDFRHDPLDTTNVAEQHPQVVARLVRELDAWRKKAAAGKVKPDSETVKTMGAEELERLRALGYVQ